MGERPGGAVIAAALLLPVAAHAQRAPVIDTEDASLGSIDAGSGRFHPILGFDLRNGDYARGGYDDDAASLDRLPAHVQVGFAWAARRDVGGAPDLWIVGTSSNGFHAPAPAERTRPRGWYESNNLVGVVARFGGRTTLGAAYTVKASPNGVSGTTHEASVTWALDGDRGFAALHPAAAVTTRTKGDGGLYAQAGLAPEIALTGAEDADTLAFPALIGVGVGGFYGADAREAVHASVGVAYTRHITLAGTRWRLRADATALIRDATIRRLGDADAERGAVVPLATVSLLAGF